MKIKTPKYFVIICFTIVFLCSCQENNSNIASKLQSKDDTILVEPSDCIFDIKGFQMNNLKTDSDFLSFNWDNIRNVGSGILSDSLMLDCSLFVCDTWGFDASYKKYDPYGHIQISPALILKLFNKLPTTPDKERFTNRLKQFEKSFAINQTINLSNEDVGEFFVKINKKNDTLSIVFNLTCYY